MKKVTEKDLSLDKQEVSALGGSNGTKDSTDICTVTTVQTTLDSNGPVCCFQSKDDKSCDTCELSQCICTVMDDTCDSYVPDCLIPIPETKGCPE